MKLALGADHFGYPLKQAIAQYLRDEHPQVEVTDLGVHDETPVDYPDVAEALAVAIAAGTYDRGILFCGTGAGMAICANKVPGVRAVCCHDIYTAERAQKSNNAQVMTLGAQVVGVETAKLLVAAWLNAQYAGGRSAPKLAKIDALETRHRLGA